ncbi:MAG: hypothetical protein A2091_12735 [Desulfuromonadales bacterium GWD2_61_12]|nr:MAG: hypothetical protein A2005_11460 [Desulfuromonadales bacterium GWC2_61_20]OGR36549.1 MAG: hypothetical protein A2091_12735 [Desulfuromonadales bacterium GWD2_61_12]HAD05058.1 hypothetical protein [Desulfuromonas sp.]HBT83959.1 hypothetical protein [Desulfuromonas sp.]
MLPCKRDSNPSLIDRPFRMTVEILLYLSLGARVFGNELGVLKVVGLSGAIILFSGVATLAIVFARQERLPASVMFAALISLIATVVDLYLVDLVPRDMLYWTSILLMMCYIVRDEGAHLRCVLFLSGCVFLSVAIGGTYYSGMHGVKRLGLESGTVGTMFGNPNDLAQIALIAGISLLFLGLRCGRLASACIMIVAIGLMGVVLLTLSRQGLILLAFGLCVYLVTVLGTQARKLEAVLLATLILGIAVIFSAEIMEIVGGFLFRLGLESSRVDYWATAPQDMVDTLMAGYGTPNAYTLEGLQPHSAFLWLHLAYGGFCALVYTAWVVWVTVRTRSLAFNQQLPATMRTEGLVMFFIFLALQFTSVFAPFNYGCILAVATLEKRFAMQGA